MEHGEEIGPKGVLQLLGADVLEPVLRMLLAGIVDQQVEPAETVRATASLQNASSPTSPAMTMQRRPCCSTSALVDAASSCSSR
jgi:hypothetical protein